MLTTRKEIAFMVLAGIFITSAIVAELISCKMVDIGLYPVIAGIAPWPVVFLLTDVMNEYFGKKTVRRLSWITCGLIAFCFLIVYLALELPTAEGSYVSDAEFRKIFGGSLPIMIGSICAFMLSQLIDVYLFGWFSRLTKGKMIWLRSTGSTVFSQLVDSYTVLIIGFLIPGKLTFDQVLIFGITGYLTKLVIAVALTPMIYVMHYAAKGILGEKPKEIRE
jgi:queuosine precursor transporter